MTEQQFLTIDGKRTPIQGEKNLLELIRRTGIEIPTFCYHSELSVYGACRLCIVDIEGMGIVTSCSTAPRAGMVVRTNTREIRETRKMTIELLLADHNMECPTCGKSGACRLQELAQQMGIAKVRFKPTREPMPIDDSNPSLLRDPNRCVLCGDCVRMCAEVQGIAAIDFAHRGAQVTVGPAFGKSLGEVDCVYCGQCARVCPTGAITPKPDIDAVWAALDDPSKVVVAQVAPAVRVAIGESFGLAAGTVSMGELVAALRDLGFDKVYDTGFAADLTVVEEANEFMQRLDRGETMPQFTSCCPAWIRFAEQNYPQLLGNLSTCRSPQQMFGAIARETLPKALGVAPENLVVVSIMPCTAKKYEATLHRFRSDGQPDVNHVLTTQEVARMIAQAGLDLRRLEPESLDMPFGFKTGAGVIFGASGGVSEAVLRYVAREHFGDEPGRIDYEQVRGEDGVREARVEVNGRTLRLAVVHGLAHARALADRVAKGECAYDFIEVMACPGGCVGGAGQPIAHDAETRARRAKGLYTDDKTLQVHTAQDNPYIAQVYAEVLGEVGGPEAHRLLHTRYHHRRRLSERAMEVHVGRHIERLPVTVCVGTSCHLRGAQKILSGLIKYVGDHQLDAYVDVTATFCMERCDRGPNVRVGARSIDHCTLEAAVQAVEEEVARMLEFYTVKPSRTTYLRPEDFKDQVYASLARFLEQRRDTTGQGPTPKGNPQHECEGCRSKTGTGCIHE